MAGWLERRVLTTMTPTSMWHNTAIKFYRLQEKSIESCPEQ